MHKLARLFAKGRKELHLPSFKRSPKGAKTDNTRRPVLKWSVSQDDCVLPDPWLLMVKAAVNVGWIMESKKFLPACPPSPQCGSNSDADEDEDDSIPAVMTIPTLGNVAKLETHEFVTVTPPDEIVHQEAWKTLVDA